MSCCEWICSCGSQFRPPAFSTCPDCGNSYMIEFDEELESHYGPTDAERERDADHAALEDKSDQQRAIRKEERENQ